MPAAARLNDLEVTRRPRAQDIDKHVGARMRERRIMLGLTQQQMAELIGVTYQQAHKYEKGINRVAAFTALPRRWASRWAISTMGSAPRQEPSGRRSSNGCSSS